MKKNNSVKWITFEDARRIAEDAARSNLNSFVSATTVNLLSDKHLEGEYCWIFFKNPEITIRPEESLRGDWAYAVSKRGNLREVVDLSGDPEKAKVYLKKMSEYFERSES